MKTSPIPKTNPIANAAASFGDRWILAIVIGLALFGLVMVYSASAVTAQANFGGQFYFLLRQSVAAVLGVGLLFGAIWLGYMRLDRPAVIYGVLGVTTVLLVTVLFLPSVRGTHRFIRLPGLMFQPSEVAKLALIAFLAFFLSRRDELTRKDWIQTFLPCTVVTAALAGLVLLGRDLGTVLIMGLVALAMCLAAGVPFKYPALIGVAALPVIIFEIWRKQYRINRLIAFLNPWEYSQNEGFQVVQSLVAVGSGGVSGLGLAQGRQKLFYLPEAHTDFIFSVIAEELGLIGAMTVVALFGALAWRGLRTAQAATDPFGKLLAVGLTVMLTSQALFNMSVVLSLVPAKGITLPFISYGGSSLMMSLLAVGLLLSVSQQARGEKRGKA